MPSWPPSGGAKPLHSTIADTVSEETGRRRNNGDKEGVWLSSQHYYHQVRRRGKRTEEERRRPVCSTSVSSSLCKSESSSSKFPRHHHDHHQPEKSPLSSSDGKNVAQMLIGDPIKSQCSWFLEMHHRSSRNSHSLVYRCVASFERKYQTDWQQWTSQMQMVKVQKQYKSFPISLSQPIMQGIFIVSSLRYQDITLCLIRNVLKWRLPQTISHLRCVNNRTSSP